MKKILIRDSGKGEEEIKTKQKVFSKDTGKGIDKVPPKKLQVR